MAGMRYLDQSHDRLDSCCAEAAESFTRVSVDKFEVMAAFLLSPIPWEDSSVSLRYLSFEKDSISPFTDVVFQGHGRKM